MNTFDLETMRWVNRLARESRTFDAAVLDLANNALFKGWALLAVLWWIWFKPAKPGGHNRQAVIATVLAAVLAVVIGRLLADQLPFRLRPLQSPDLGFVLPYGVKPDSLRTWSSFPSDHAMVFFALAAGLWSVSRWLCAAALVYVTCVIALPRVYLGYHYPTDIAGGALLGILIACAANLGPVRERVSAPILKWQDRHPSSFYVFFLFFSQGLATMFDAVRHLARPL